MINLTALHSFMNKKKFYYFEGNTNDRDSNLYISFSTLYDGKGNYIEFRLGDNDNDLSSDINYNKIELKNISDNDVFLFIEKYC